MKDCVKFSKQLVCKLRKIPLEMLLRFGNESHLQLGNESHLQVARQGGI